MKLLRLSHIYIAYRMSLKIYELVMFNSFFTSKSKDGNVHAFEIFCIV